MPKVIKRIAGWLLAGSICFAFMAHCGNVSISKKLAAAEIPGVGSREKSG